MSRRNYYDDYDNYYEYNYRPELPNKTEQTILNNAEQTFQRNIQQSGITLDTAIKHGQEYAQTINQNHTLLNYGPYVLYLKAWFTINPETEQQHNMRLAGNHIRHNILDYEKILNKTKAKWWVPEQFFDQLWQVALHSIETVFPETKIANDALKQARHYYRQYPYTENNPIVIKVNNEYELLLEQQENEREEQEQREQDEIRKIQQEEQALRREELRQRSKMCRLVSSLFKNPPDNLQVKHQGNYYPIDKIVKVNPVKIRVQFTLKNGQTRIKDVLACFLYQDNYDKFPTVDGYETVDHLTPMYMY